MLRVSSEEINGGTSPEDLEVWDSMQHLVIVSGFEEEFNIDIEPEEALEMYKNYQTFKSVIMAKVN